ncbi:hypothetical protein LD11_gp022 [Bacillus phage Riley]|uniref:Uncharacterized protein n=3 Tax=Caudoviricetes TaxID=2731619 RepID=A0A075LYG9_9CAUD|nr:hypothetical protein LD11_gp022 [Bacillus phage Riley]YP_009289902.1 hypothetical protein BI003_gp023 [Bacillus phage Phrodo]ASZ75756.1 hypothetical protein TAFFO16_23 [Bacillus phage Taffo16]ULF48644.1 hypothetical protein [Bacillus phage BillyBob]AIF71898.1 hypothetical protein [Bacillus phage Riley]AMW62071.1 hypothetical protein PHRODO_23 [Bacillus phage Phrodo]
MDVEQCWDCGKLVSSGIIWDDKVICFPCIYEEDERRIANGNNDNEEV